jgi:hypothetical protein
LRDTISAAMNRWAIIGCSYGTEIGASQQPAQTQAKFKTQEEDYESRR